MCAGSKGLGFTRMILIPESVSVGERLRVQEGSIQEHQLVVYGTSSQRSGIIINIVVTVLLLPRNIPV